MPEQDTKFCDNCGLPFIHQWNKNLDDAYKNSNVCCKRCYRAWVRKEKIRSEKSAPKYGVLS